MLTKIRKSLKCQKGFTLVELMAVIAIIAVLAAIALPRFTDATKDAQSAKILADLRTIDSAVSMYFAANNAYPTYAQLTANTTFLAAAPVPPVGTYGIEISAPFRATWAAASSGTARFSNTPKNTIKGDLP